MENTNEEVTQTLFEKIVNGALDIVRIPLKKRALRLKFISAYNDLLSQRAEAEKAEMKELEQLDDMDMVKFLDAGNDIDDCDKAILRLEKGFRKLFNEDMPKEV